jgi:hypothetical protein
MRKRLDADKPTRKRGADGLKAMILIAVCDRQPCAIKLKHLNSASWPMIFLEFVG